MNSHQIKLPVSGVVLTIRRQPLDVVASIQMRAMELHERPTPPIVKEEVGPGKFVERENHTDTGYIEALREYENAWKASFAQMLVKVLVRTCIVSDENMRAYLDEAREMQQTYAELGIRHTENTLEFALEYLIAVAQEDMQHLMMEVFGRTLPTEVQVALRASMFQSNVQAP